MLVTSFIFLLLNLSLLKCASTEDQKDVDNNVSETKSSKLDIFSKHLNGELLHQVLQYDAKSTGRMAKANKDLKALVEDSRAFRFFEGAGWDMSELANVWDFVRNRPEVEAEMAKIMELSHIKDESDFNQKLENLFIYDAFKELSRPVLKYLVRRFYVNLKNGKVSDEDGARRRTYLEFAFWNRFYDIFFELGNDFSVWNGLSLKDIVIVDGKNDSFYFECYNNYAYDNRAASEIMWKKMAAIESNDYDSYRYETITPGGAKLSRNEIYAWVSVCIYRRVPEEKYADLFSKIPKTFLDIIHEYVYKYSPITLDAGEMDYYHGFIGKLLDKYFSDPIYKDMVEFIRLSNDVRFRNYNDNINHILVKRVMPYYTIFRRHGIELLAMAASRANNKLLVKYMALHPHFEIRILKSIVEPRCPQSFKVYFDLIEGKPLQDNYNIIDYVYPGLDSAIFRNKIKTTETISALGKQIEIEMPAEYLKLGFAPKYSFCVKSYY